VNSNGNVADPRAHAHDGPTPRSGTPSQNEQETLAAGVGSLLVELRKSVHMSQEAAAARAGISVSYLRRLEHGRRRPSGEMLAVLAVVFTRRPSDPMVALARLLEAVGASIGNGSARRLSRTARGHLADLVARERLVHGAAVRDRGPELMLAPDAQARVNPRVPRLADVRELAGPALHAVMEERMKALPDLDGPAN